MKKFYAILFVFLLSINIAFSGAVTQANISTLYATAGPYYVVLNTNISNSPQCASNITRFAVNPSVSSGKAMIATLLTAYSTGAKVTITGANSCNIDGVSEDISFFCINC